MESGIEHTRDNDYLSLACPQPKEFDFIRRVHALCECLCSCHKRKYHSCNVLCTVTFLVIFCAARISNPSSYCIHRLYGTIMA